jgi:hypothetical protein
VLGDLSALTPPFLVCAAFLTAVAAFLRHEMRAAKKQGDEQSDSRDEQSDRRDDASRAEHIEDEGSGRPR